MREESDTMSVVPSDPIELERNLDLTARLDRETRAPSPETVTADVELLPEASVQLTLIV